MVIDIAGIAVKIHPGDGHLKRVCEPFATDAPPVAELTAADVERRMEQLSATYPDTEHTSMIESSATLELLHEALIPNGCMFFHAALMEVDGATYAIAGPSGAGKSTLARLWRDCLGASIVNGDKPFLRLTDGGWYGASSPWRGKEAWGQPGVFAPLRAICFREQSSDDAIERLDPEQAVERILRQTHMPDTLEGAHALLDLVDDLACTMPAYTLRGDATEDFARLSYRAVSGAR